MNFTKTHGTRVYAKIAAHIFGLDRFGEKRWSAPWTFAISRLQPTNLLKNRDRNPKGKVDQEQD